MPAAGTKILLMRPCVMNNPTIAGILNYAVPNTILPAFLERAHNELGRARLGFVLYALTGMLKRYDEDLPFDVLHGGEWCQDLAKLLEL
jgi:hypothetical protein